MALMKEIYPFVARINGEQQYAIGGSRTAPDNTPLPPEVVHTAPSSSMLGKTLGIDYFSRTGGARIEYEAIPADITDRLDVIRPLSPQEREEFFEEFRRHASR